MQERRLTPTERERHKGAFFGVIFGLVFGFILGYSIHSVITEDIKQEYHEHLLRFHKDEPAFETYNLFKNNLKH